MCARDGVTRRDLKSRLQVSVLQGEHQRGGKHNNVTQPDVQEVFFNIYKDVQSLYIKALYIHAVVYVTNQDLFADIKVLPFTHSIKTFLRGCLVTDLT